VFQWRISLRLGRLHPKNGPLIHSRRQVSGEAQEQKARQCQVTGRKLAADSGRITCVSDTRIVGAESVEICQCSLHSRMWPVVDGP
jgi:hypothetical protein